MTLEINLRYSTSAELAAANSTVVERSKMEEEKIVKEDALIQKKIFDATSPKEAMTAVIFGASFFLIILMAPNSSTFSTSATLSSSYILVASSSYGATYGSGSYSNGTTANFGVSPTTVYDSAGTTRYIFAGWSCSGNGCYSGSSASASVAMNDNIVESADWITQYLLSTSVTGNGSANPFGQNWYDAGSTVSVSETSPGAAWIFAYWGLDGQNVGSSQTYTVSMDSPHDLVANFIDAEIQSKLVNVTDSYGDNLRNPDGTFYRLDKFEIQYNVTIVGGNSTLPPSLTFDVNLTYPRNVLNEILKGRGYVVFIVLPNAALAPYHITLNASIVKSVDGSRRPIPNYQQVPFAVVDYSPHFADFTYMDYNALNSSTYERSFVVLTMYDGNSPGYSYSGDINTDPFSATNSTDERGIVNSLTFATNGWSISSNISMVNDSLGVMNFLYHPNLSLSVAILNNKTGSPTIMNWSDRVYKYYFLANVQQLKNYVNTSSIIYVNVTVNAWYVNTYNSDVYRTSDFNTSYLYQPIFFNGYLVFKPYGGAQANFSVSIVSHNPSPLDSYLISQSSSIFGNYSIAIGSLEQDLYPAYSTTILKPLISNPQEWVFLVNQTNLATSNSDAMPYFTISVSGRTGYTRYAYEIGNPPHYLSAPVTQYNQSVETTTYNVSDYFGLFGVSDFSASSFPFRELTGYYFMQPATGQDLVMQPLNFSFSSPSSASIPYLIRTYSNFSAPFFVSFEPGNLTHSYAMVYGENLTTSVSPNLVGGGIMGLDGIPVALNGGTDYEVSLVMGYQSGGASDVWVVNDKGQVLYNESLPMSSFSSISGLFGPVGYVGEYTLQFPMENTSSSVTIYVENTWGGLSIIQGMQITPQSPPALYYSPNFLAAILVVVFGISAGYKILSKKYNKDKQSS